MIFDENSGEVIKDKFAQLYFNDIGKLFDLSVIGYSTLLLMARSVGLGNGSSINMIPRRKKEYAEILKCSPRQIHNVLSDMEEKNIIKRLEKDEYPHKYTLNPDIIFSGNEYQRVKVMIDYSNGERMVRVFKNEKQLREFIKGDN